jgi:uncharacterized membrane protein
VPIPADDDELREARPPCQGGDAPAAFPSDKLPLTVLAGLVMCAAIYLLAAGRSLSPGAAATGLSARLGAPTRDVEVCNRAGAGRLYVAFAYYDRLQGDWVARGWFPQDDGGCRVVMMNLEPPVYVYAETRDGERHWDGGGDGRDFCINAQDGFIVNQRRCLTAHGSGLAFRHFRRLASTGRDVWEITP